MSPKSRASIKMEPGTVKMEPGTDLVRQQQQPLPDPPSSSSGALKRSRFVSDAGGDPGQVAVREDSESLFAENQELKDEIANLQRSCLEEVHVSRIKCHETATLYGNRHQRAMQDQEQRFREAAHQFKQTAEEATEAAVARERQLQRAAQQKDP